MSKVNMDEAVLKEGEFFEDYVQRIDNTAPYGRDPKGNAHLFPMGKFINHSAYRFDMEYQSDWSSFRKTGLGSKMNPTIFIGLIFFLPTIILLPLLYYIYTGSVDIALADLRIELSLYIPYILIIIFMTKLIGYGTNRLEDLLKPYGKDHESIQLLFKDELEFLKFSKMFFNRLFDYKWMWIGFIGFVIVFIYGFIGVLDVAAWRKAVIDSRMPDWSRFILIISTLGVALIAFVLLSFFWAIFYGLFVIGDLGSDRSKLSINRYNEMISTINDMIAEAQSLKIKMTELGKKLDISGRTYYEFQRGNRKIGEFLFNIAALLILICAFFGFYLWIANVLDLLPENLKTLLMIVAVVLTLSAFLSLAIFIIPQYRIHRFLKQFKYTLVDLFSSLLSRLEYIYFEAMIHPDILLKIDEEWKTKNDLAEDIHLIKEVIEEVKSYGTWSYDFPEVIKLIVVAAVTLIPIVLTFVQL